MIKKITITIALLTLIIAQTDAQKTVTFQNQQWVQYYNTTKISKNWTINADAGYRWQNAFSHPSQYLARIGASYKIDPQHMQVGAGFAIFGFYTADTVSRIEMRPYQEFIVNDKYKKFKIQHRVRVEERFFQTVNSDKNNFNFRFRYRMYFTVPVLKLSKTNEEAQLSLNIGDEIFVNAGKEIVNNMFNQNRFLVGPLVQLNKNWGVSLIYTYEFQSRAKAGNYVASDIFWLGIQHRLDFTGSGKSGRSGTKGQGNGSKSGKGSGSGDGKGDGSGNENPTK